LTFVAAVLVLAQTAVVVEAVLLQDIKIPIQTNQLSNHRNNSNIFLFSKTFVQNFDFILI
jgi:hypothetical protein